MARNGPDSQSGWAVAQEATPFVERPTWSKIIDTGSHAASLAAVINGQADLAYIDAVTWRLLKRYEQAEVRVHLAGRSITTPGLPLITALGTDPTPLRAALRDAFLTLPDGYQADLGGLRGFVVMDPDKYLSLQIPDALA